MPYLHPGVYVEETPRGSKQIEGVGTSTAAFIGYAYKGSIGEPKLISKWGDYNTEFGGVQNMGNNTQGDSMGLSVSAFFLNGGGKAYIVRITEDWMEEDPTITHAEKALAYVDNPIDPANKALKFSAVNEGAWANGIVVKLSVSTLAISLYDVEVGRNDDRDEFYAIESFASVSLNDTDPKYIESVINGLSSLVTVELVDGISSTEVIPDSDILLEMLDGGADGGEPGTEDYNKIFTQFIKIRDINTICLPGQHWSTDNSGNPVIQNAITHAEKMKSCMVIVDPPPGHELDSEKKVVDMELPSQPYCALYYPWVQTTNQFYHAEYYPGLPKNVLVPPSGYAAGMWAKIDGRRGVWKAPAGTATGLLGISELEYVVENDEQGSLNPLGINCFRSMPGAGKVIWGARTRATRTDPEWRYIPVRRTAIMIEQSIYIGTQWAVFEPNDHRLWSALRATIGNFMNDLFRGGAFQGRKASDAFFVRCGLGDTMTQSEIDAGQVVVIVGFAPLKPAEFVIINIRQKVNQ